MKAVILPLFSVRRGRLSHGRITAELAKCESTSGKRKTAVAAREAKKHNENNGPAASNDAQMMIKSESESQSDKNIELTRIKAREREALDRLEKRLRQVAGPALRSISTGLFNLAPILRLIDPAHGEPCDLEADVIATIRAKAPTISPNTVGGWAYFETSIIEARDRRLRPLPAVSENPTNGTDTRSAKHAASLANMERAFRAAEQFVEPARPAGG